MVLQRLRGADIEVAAITGAWAVLFMLVMARMAGLVRGIERSEVERRNLLDQTMHAAEQERIRIAAELHDGPIQRLSVLSYDLERAKQRVLTNPAAVARLEHAQQVGAFTRHSGVDCEVRVALARRLGGELETIVYRVAQEALLNVTRHA
jgi:signal transduction histidine kinase